MVFSVRVQKFQTHPQKFDKFAVDEVFSYSVEAEEESE